MKNNTARRRFSVFTVIITLLGLLLVILIMVAIRRSTPEDYSYISRPSSLLFSLQNGRYTQAVSEVTENRAVGVDESTDQAYAAPYAVCDYFTARSYYEAYVRAGDQAGAAAYQAQMDDAYARMGDLQYMADDIAEALK